MPVREPDRDPVPVTAACPMRISEPIGIFSELAVVTCTRMASESMDAVVLLTDLLWKLR